MINQQERIHMLIIRQLVLSVLLLLFSFAAYSQDYLDTALQANESVHEFDMRYTGSSAHVDPNYYYRLDEFADWIKSDTTFHVRVRGHVCCGPSMKLSEKRAKAVYKYLLKAGVPEERICWKGYSDRCPKVWPEKKKEDAEQNRRVDFVIIKLD